MARPTWRQWLAGGLRGIGYGALAGAVAGAAYQAVRRVLPALLVRLGVVPYPAWAPRPGLFDGLGLIALLGASGGVFFGALLGLGASVAVNGLLWWRMRSGAHRAAPIRAIVLGVLAIGWLANAAISPWDWWELLSMAELGLAMLIAGWWLGGRLARHIGDAVAPRRAVHRP